MRGTYHWKEKHDQYYSHFSLLRFKSYRYSQGINESGYCVSITEYDDGTTEEVVLYSIENDDYTDQHLPISLFITDIPVIPIPFVYYYSFMW